MSDSGHGGPAFPAGSDFGTCVEVWKAGYGGLTIRDYFAASAPPPTTYEMGEHLGWPVEDMKPGDSDAPMNEQWDDTFDKRWAELPLRMKQMVVAELAYIYADAMLEARKTKESK